MWRFYGVIKKNFQEESQKNLQPLECKIDEALEAVNNTQKEILRLQILEGIDSHRLSESEVEYFYDKYHKVGGNSFVTAKVNKYISDMREESEDNEN